MTKTKADLKATVDDRGLYSGLIRLYVLHHAAEKPLFGLGILEDLGQRRYKISAGTLYPLLHNLEKKGYLASTERRDGKSRRKVYRATALGRRALTAAKGRIREFIGELIEGESGRAQNKKTRV